MSDLSAVLLRKQAGGTSTTSAAHAASPADIPLWRREDLWRASDPAAREKAAMCEDFEYVFDAMPSLGGTDESSGVAVCEPLRILEDHDEIGHRVWDGAMVLSKFMERLMLHCTDVLAALERSGASNEDKAVLAAALSAFNLDGRSVLEVGSGTGIVAMVIAALAAVRGQTPTIVATDIPSVIPKLSLHLSRNACGAAVTARPLHGATQDMRTPSWESWQPQHTVPQPAQVLIMSLHRILRRRKLPLQSCMPRCVK